MQGSSLGLAKRIFGLIAPHRSRMIVALIFLAAGSGINLLFPELIRRLLNHSTPRILLENFAPIAAGLFALIFVQAVCYYARGYLFGQIGQQVVAKLRGDLYSAIMRQNVAFFDSHRTGDLISRLSADTQLLQNTVSVNVSVLLRYVLQVIVGVILMCLLSVRLTLTILILLPILIGISMLLAKKLRHYSKLTQAELGTANVIAEETGYAVRTVKGFGQEDHEIARYTSAIRRSFDYGMKRLQISAFFQSFVSALMNASIVVVLWLGVELVTGEKLSVGDLTAFLLYGVIVAVSLGFLSNIYSEFMQALGAADRVFEVIDSHRPPLHQATILKMDDWSGAVRFDDVSFSYPSRPEMTILKNFSFQLRNGETLALVGPSGSGKSTVVSLLLRFYEPSGGRIYFDTSESTTIDQAALRFRIGLVSQDTELFSVSLLDNIRYGRPTATDNEIREACRKANILDFIESLPQKFETLVGDRGLQLSGGERQRVSIARALLRNPTLLILDEATSALDSANEALVQDALKTLMLGRTTIVIAHRLSTVKSADSLIVLNQGEIVQRGNHTILSTQPGLYRDLLEKQEMFVGPAKSSGSHFSYEG